MKIKTRIIAIMIILVCISLQTITVSAKEDYTKNDLKYMASIIYAEAGNQCYAGKLAVGIVVMNRVESKEFPNSIKSVLYQKNQFGPAKNGSLEKAIQLYKKGKLPKSCIKAAKEALQNKKTITYSFKFLFAIVSTVIILLPHFLILFDIGVVLTIF